MSLQHWLLHFGAASGELRLVVADFLDWLGNRRTPWSAYQSLMAVRLIALEKQPGVRPARSGKTLWWFMAKCVLRVTGQESKAACGTEQIAVGVKSGIEGGIHDMLLLQAQNSQEEYWGFLLIDAWNAFNEENQTAIIWTALHEWPSGV